MKIYLLLPIFLLVSACSSTSMMETLSGSANSHSIHQFANASTIEEIRKLRPQAKLPLKIAVLPPYRWDSVSFEERKVIDQWGEKLRETGFVSSLQIVPRSLWPKCHYQSDSDCYLNESRMAGARLGANAILFLSDTTATDQYVNPASILNISIIGLWLVPAHHRDSYSIFEASLFDIDNGYMYTVAEGLGQHKTVRPYMYTDRNTGQQEARLAALENLGEKLFDMAEQAVSNY